MQIHNHYSLKDLNTFGIDVEAKSFIEINNPDDLKEAITEGVFRNNFLILGGGSNILFTKDVDGVVVKNNLKGIFVIEENDHEVLITAMSGELWHHLVMFCVERNLGGIENLSLIPGTVGAAPIQNIGAYGVELKNTLIYLHAVNLESGEVEKFENPDCNFGYRDSVFKNELKGKYFIFSITLKLKKNVSLNISYGAIKDVLQTKNILSPSIKDVSDAVIFIRKSKLPDPVEIGNAGSFFKNPEISRDEFELLKKNFPEIPSYPSKDKIKIPAGWLIEQCGWKGKIIGNTGAHKYQALVLVNYGNATGEEIFALALKIKKSVFDKFGVEIVPEVNVV